MGKKRGRGSGQKQSYAGLVLESAALEKYYSFIPRQDELWRTLREPLPLSFRVVERPGHEHLREKLRGEWHDYLLGQKWDGKDVGVPVEVPFYPLAYQVDVPKQVIRKNAQFKRFQKFLVNQSEVGSIARQEVVSMIPPLVLDVQPHHNVLDLCASPGSKTLQIVEQMHCAGPFPTGFVVANDIDAKRAYMLVHQTKAMRSPNLAITAHDAAIYPSLILNGQKLLFDRILADVPCSGDGTLRKNPDLWKGWSVRLGMGLHKMQLRILSRAIQLLKPGGRLVYSTCSMNPIENEAVVGAALNEFGSMKLVDCDLPGLIGEKGLTDWKVMGYEGEYLDSPFDGAKKVPETCFPCGAQELEKCIRIYPHYQNSGGFFIACLEKQGKVATKRKRDEEKVDSVPSGNSPSTPSENTKEDPFIYLDPDSEPLSEIYKFLGIDRTFPASCFVRNPTGEAVRSIYFSSPSLRPLILQNPTTRFLHAGVKMFGKQNMKNQVCPWRIQSSGLWIITPFLDQSSSTSRLVMLTLDDVRKLVNEPFPRLELWDAESPLRKIITSLANGCLVGQLEDTDIAFPLWKTTGSLNMMLAKEDKGALVWRLFADDGEEPAVPETDVTSTAKVDGSHMQNGSAEI